MKNWLNIAQIVVAILLTISVLMQNRGSGLGAVFGGEGNVYKTKRGAEKILFWLTIIFSVIFLALSLAVYLI